MTENDMYKQVITLPGLFYNHILCSIWFHLYFFLPSTLEGRDKKCRLLKKLNEQTEYL